MAGPANPAVAPPPGKSVRVRRILAPLLVAGVIVGLVAAVTNKEPSVPQLSGTAGEPELAAAVAQVDAYFARRWEEADLEPAAIAPELQILRRLSLALHGTIPSLEEVRQFEADAAPRRLERWTQRLVEDPRFGVYFAQRLARAFVGTEGGQFIVFRRDRFVQWLGDEITHGTPYDEIVRRMIAGTGLWTGDPETNFITAAANGDLLDREKLAGRTVRAFLGQRIDCAQCHDHPFADWKQEQFAGLTAYYAQVQRSIVVEDKTGEYEMEDPKTKEKSVVAPTPPFHPEWITSTGTRREQLAQWVTAPQNRRFQRAIANRVWGILFGRAYVEPVDDLPDPTSAEPDLLDLLGQDFQAHGYDLRRLVQVIAASQPFRLDSVHVIDHDPEISELRAEWAVFPLIRLRPEQMIGAIMQTSTVRTIDQESHVVTRFIRYFRENDFVKGYGDLGDNELEDRPGTIPQVLLRMNDRLVTDSLDASPLSSIARIAAMAPTAEQQLEVAYLVCLTRRPTPAESTAFVAMLGESKEQDTAALEDFFWSCVNTLEFSWNH